MARKRQIDPSFWASEQVISLSRDARLLYVGMISHADDAGRLRAGPGHLKAIIFPSDSCAIEEVRAWRDAIIATGLVILYTDNGAEFLCHPNWARYQYMTRRFDSKLPPPPVNDELSTSYQQVITPHQQAYGIGIGDGGGVGIGTVPHPTTPQPGGSFLPEDWTDEMKEASNILLGISAINDMAQANNLWFLQGMMRLQENTDGHNADDILDELRKFREWWIAKSGEGKPLKRPFPAIANWLTRAWSPYQGKSKAPG